LGICVLCQKKAAGWKYSSKTEVAMRVLFIQQGLGYGGASQSLIQMQKCLKDDVEIFTILKKNRRLNQKLKHLLIHSKEIVEMDIPGVYNYSEGKS